MIIRKHKRVRKNKVTMVKSHSRKEKKVSMPISLGIPGIRGPQDYLKTYFDKPRKRTDNFTLYDIM